MIFVAAALLFQFQAVTLVKTLPQGATSQPTAELRVAVPGDIPKATEAATAAKTPTADDAKPSPQPVKLLTEPAATSMSNVYLPPPPAFRPPYETPMVHRRLWFVLTSAEHGAATYDAWSTRRAILSGRVEADPVMRPFAGSAAIYGAIQVVPFGLDYLAHRLQRSSGWARHIWWAPQSIATATFLFSGSYNVLHTN